MAARAALLHQKVCILDACSADVLLAFPLSACLVCVMLCCAHAPSSWGSRLCASCTVSQLARQFSAHPVWPEVPFAEHC